MKFSSLIGKPESSPTTATIQENGQIAVLPHHINGSPGSRYQNKLLIRLVPDSRRPKHGKTVRASTLNALEHLFPMIETVFLGSFQNGFNIDYRNADSNFF
jgi:hypothetical protein